LYGFFLSFGESRLGANTGSLTLTERNRVFGRNRSFPSGTDQLGVQNCRARIEPLQRNLVVASLAPAARKFDLDKELN
jgi:hypothetical protein